MKEQQDGLRPSSHRGQGKTKRRAQNGQQQVWKGTDGRMYAILGGAAEEKGKTEINPENKYPRKKQQIK